MEEKQIPKRKPIRWEKHDYSDAGRYFITICTEGRKPILSRIISVGEGSPLPQNKVILSCFGKIIEKNILNIPMHFLNVQVDRYVIMPNHIHMILWVKGLSLDENSTGGETPPLRKSIMDVIGWMKYFATKEINEKRGTQGKKVFQRSFYDRVIRDEKEYVKVCNYIYENPFKWREDELYAE